jgi:nucleotide-binding universal stress UspA family protein
MRVPVWLRVNKPALNRHRIAAAQAWLDRRLEAVPRSAGATHVLVGDKAEDIATFASGRDADLLLVTVPAVQRMRRVVDSGTASRLLCVARCPVLVLPRAKQSRHSGKPRLDDAA